MKVDFLIATDVFYNSMSLVQVFQLRDFAELLAGVRWNGYKEVLYSINICGTAAFVGYFKFLMHLYHAHLSVPPLFQRGFHLMKDDYRDKQPGAAKYWLESRGNFRKINTSGMNLPYLYKHFFLLKLCNEKRVYYQRQLVILYTAKNHQNMPEDKTNIWVPYKKKWNKYAMGWW